MRDTIKLRVYSPTQGGGNGSFRLIWEKLLLETWRDYKEAWYKGALTKPINELDVDEEWLRINFNDNCDRDGLKQGDLLCVGKKQCYII
tara:strand:- start:1944 stop:2210 length:267 start_codon:yes stop_codon:yes gene_type:complete